MPTAMSDLPVLMHTGSTTAQGSQLTDAVQHMVTPVHTYLNIPPPPPFLLHSGTPLHPWKMWFIVFSSFLHLLEEERREPLPDIICNSLLFGLLGTGGHQQLAESPVMEMLHTAPFGVFAKYIASHFECRFSTVSTTQGLQHQGGGEEELHWIWSKLNWRWIKPNLIIKPWSWMSKVRWTSLAVELPLLHLFLQWSQSLAVPMHTPFLF